MRSGASGLPLEGSAAARRVRAGSCDSAGLPAPGPPRPAGGARGAARVSAATRVGGGPVPAAPANPWRMAGAPAVTRKMGGSGEATAGHADCKTWRGRKGASDMQILVVDDSRAMRSIVMRAVRQAGYEASFVEATNGVEALEVIRRSPPTLVMADWNMPEMSGIALLQALRAEGNPVKVGFVTSESDPSMRDLAFQAGALFMLGKPFTPDAIKAVLDPVLT